MRSVAGAVKAQRLAACGVTRSAATNTIAFYVNGVAKGTGTDHGRGDTGERADFDRPGEERRALCERPAGRGRDLPGCLTPAQVATHFVMSTA